MAKMRTEQEVEAEIKKVTESYQHVLDCGPATVQINSPRALMQLSGITALNQLYWFLKKERPKFTCDDNTKTDY